MITAEELKEYARMTGLALGHAEKDYFQNILLFIISRIHGADLVFKGGTALKKCYGLDRFSEDLDFTCREEVKLRNILNGLKRFRIEYEMEKETYERGLKVILRIKGPLYSLIRQSLCRLVLDFSFREKIIEPPVTKTIGRFLEEIPVFDVFVMNKKEILAEKVRAVVTRQKARDLYDIWFLIGNGVSFDIPLIRKKLEYYGKKWDAGLFIRHVMDKKNVWKSELGPLVSRLPDFDNVSARVLNEVK
ncbi:MAG: nucleotidyl transferase AbiEii/AbiGii toxin family protein [Candidatus Aenigmarchaeota archaeon]|nr:nucleotidyl transferase AbiEii/AbiGii toxin family protein [Candidatus Aenigmarchaeota archaeon]